jgi:hypothetical protein
MRLPIKWRFFQVANYFLLIPFLGLLSIIIYGFINGNFKSNGIIFSILIILVPLLFILNSIFNLFLIHKYFPKKPLIGKMRVLYIFSTILFSLSILAILLVSVSSFNEELKESRDNNTGFVMAIILMFLSLISCFVLVMQLSVKKNLDKNQKDSIITLIEDIGND